MLQAADTALLRLLRTRGHTPAAEGAIRGLSALGEHGSGWIALALAGAGLDERRRPAWLRAAATVAGAYAANQGLKVVVRRRRPRLPGLPPLIHTVSSLSYPSAHAATAFAGARAMHGLLPAAVLYPLAGAMALSRPYLGVHYPLDSLAGAALGASVAELAR